MEGGSTIKWSINDASTSNQQQFLSTTLTSHVCQRINDNYNYYKNEFKVLQRRITFLNSLSSLSACISSKCSAFISIVLILILASYACSPTSSQITLSRFNPPNVNHLLQPKTIYSKKEPRHGIVFNFNTHEIRRNRQKRNVAENRADNDEQDNGEKSKLRVIGLARQCGVACTFRLKSDFVNHQSDVLTAEKELKVNFRRWKQVSKPINKADPDFENGRVVPLIQYMDSANSTHARLSKVSPDCLYSASVEGSLDEGMVNLCEKHGGLFGTLALPDGAYMIEPFQHSEFKSHQDQLLNQSAAENPTEDNYLRKKRSISYDLRPHLIYKAELQSFEHPIDHADGHKSSKSASMDPEDDSYVNNTEWLDINPRNQRSRRSADSWDHYVEVLVVADYKMLLYHQSNLESYVLTLFSTVASIYRHPTLRASINIIVVRVIILKHERAGPLISNRAQETLQQFCAWQQNYNDRNDDSISHHDVAILLTRHDICRATHKCDTLGLAELGTMCDPMRSCAIIEDNGLSAAFTIAHELGHIFNIPHDDERKCSNYMRLIKTNYHIMAPTLEYNTNPWSWSPCSSAMLGKFLDDSRAQTQCILDQPIERKYFDKMYEQPYPGAKYSVNQQCQFVFGSNAEICPYMPTCRRLWCSTYIGYQMGCRTQHMPWADGTPCGTTKWCHGGHCVGMAPDQRSKTDGAWGEWRPWGSCSRTCGGGVQKALRDCDNPKPSNGGKYCVGQRERYRPCNIQECPWDTPGFRDLQCTAFNNKDVGIHGVPVHTTWVPKYNGISHNERCKLYCRIKDSQAFYLLKEKVDDGTPCDQNGDHICIDGTCHKAGCDHRLGSEMKRDICGICGGDGSTCKTVEGIYNERGSFGYNEVLKIPAGSANIDIQQNAHNRNKDDDNYLALRSSNGEFLLNGHYQVSVFRQKVPVQDVVLEYSGSDHSIERINGTGPIRSDIYLHVLSVGNLYPPNIHYKYMVPRDTYSPQVHYRSLYYWRFSDQYTECSSMCQGTQDRQLHCIDATTNRHVDERHCVDRKPPPQKRMCNIDCFIKWRTKDVSGCSARCGTGEIHRQSICIKIDPNGREDSINEADCRRSGLEKPAERVSCYSDCTGRKWAYTEWGQCTTTCGNNGISQRTAYCVDNSNRKLDERHCERISRDVVQQECNRVPCPKWTYGHWSECSRSCDGGVRMRHAQCQSAAGQDLPAHSCDINEKRDRESCNDHVCTTWKFGTWSACSVSCGVGQETRTAECVDSRGRTVDDSICDRESKIVQKKCERADCPHWETSAFGPCSVTCQEGWATRSVYCVDSNGKKVRDDVCKTTKPQSHQACNNGPCPFWRTGDWSRCSVTCGYGVKHREVECLFRDQTVDNSLCQESIQPKHHEQCKLLPCTSWQTEPWGECSENCTQRREVKCMRDQRNRVQVDVSECSHHLKPRLERVCDKERCSSNVPKSPMRQTSQIYWATGPWTDCSASCSNGTQKRAVACRDNVRQLPDQYCQHLEKESDTRACNVKPCSQWTAGPWQPCPSTCGVHHVQRRTVVCTPAPGAAATSMLILPDSDCDITSQPVFVRNCGLAACPTESKPDFGRWRTGNWHACSASCGGGWRRRTVTCDKSICDEQDKPPIFERCSDFICRKAAWQMTPWSTCSVSCGNDGYQERQIWCQEDINSMQRLDDSECAKHEPKPITKRGCASQACPVASSIDSSTSSSAIKLKSFIIDDTTNKYYWQPGNWSPCSTKCGKGTRTRQVLCIRRKSNETVTEDKCDMLLKPLTEHKCRQALCPRWHKGKWSTCNASCGIGVRKRTVYCKRGRDQLSESECSAHPKPQETEQCTVKNCPTYSWKVTPWSRCIDPCKKMNQHRRVFCLNEAGKRAANRMCQNQTIPIKSRPCNTDTCPYEWVPGPWSTCSSSCGTGIHFRRIDCKVKKGMRGQSTKSGSEPRVLARMCMSLEKPEVNKECNMNPCDAEYRWSVNAWEPCSKSCGPGYRRRKTPCLDRDGNKVHKKLCDRKNRPKHREDCFIRNCLPNDCAEIKAQNTKSNSIDGNYTVLVAGFRVTVYCHLMNNTIPKTFLNIAPETNFGEFYGKRLLDPQTCPYGGKRNDSCDCSNDGHVNNGLTRFSRVRVDLHNMKIIPHDFSFAQTPYGTHVPFGTAGDCYSSSDCPQGRFSIDLRGTGLKIVDDLQWMDNGHKSSSKIVRSDNNALVRGQCGGFCGECAPDQYKGIVIEIDQKQRPSIGVG